MCYTFNSFSPSLILCNMFVSIVSWSISALVSQAAVQPTVRGYAVIKAYNEHVLLLFLLLKWQLLFCWLWQRWWSLSWTIYLSSLVECQCRRVGLCSRMKVVVSMFTSCGGCCWNLPPLTDGFFNGAFGDHNCRLANVSLSLFTNNFADGLHLYGPRLY